MDTSIFARSGFSYDRLRVLVDVAEAGSIVKAAGGDPVRQSQYSRQLKELEQFFECKLTERKGRTLSMTAAGARLAKLAREQFNALEHFATESGALPLTVRIGAGESLIKWLLIPALARMVDGAGDVRWSFANLQTRDIVDRLLDQRLDFGLVRGFESNPPLDARELGVFPSALFVPSCMVDGLPKGAGTALAGLPMALLAGRSRLRALIEETCRTGGREPDIRFECTSQPEIAELVRHGLAAGVLPTIARREFEGVGVREVDIDGMAGAGTRLSLVWNPRMLALSGRLERLRDALAASLAAGGG